MEKNYIVSMDLDLTKLKAKPLSALTQEDQIKYRNEIGEWEKTKVGEMPKVPEQRVLKSSEIFMNLVVTSLTRVHPKGKKETLLKCKRIYDVLENAINTDKTEIILKESDYKLIKSSIDKDEGWPHQLDMLELLSQMEVLLSKATKMGVAKLDSSVECTPQGDK